jgi:hypothetical protein
MDKYLLSSASGLLHQEYKSQVLDESGQASSKAAISSLLDETKGRLEKKFSGSIKMKLESMLEEDSIKMKLESMLEEDLLGFLHTCLYTWLEKCTNGVK